MIKKLLLSLMLLTGVMAFGQQASRWDGIAPVLTGNNLYTPVSNGTVLVYNYPGPTTNCATAGTCTLATTYTDDTAGASCGTSTPLTHQLSIGCTGSTDSGANFGFWVKAGKYQYCITGTGVGTSCNNITVGTVFQYAGSGIFTNTQMNQAVTSSVNGLDFKAEFQAPNGNQYTTSAGAFGVTMPLGATILQADGLEGYVLNQSNGGAGVGVYGQARCASPANGARCWGSTFVSTDYPVTATLNPQSSTLYGIETDVDPANTSDGTIGYMALLNSSLFVLNSLSYTGGTGFLVGGNYRDHNILWSTGFATQDAGAVAFGTAGARCLTGTCASQQMNFSFFNANVENSINILSDASGDFQINMPAGGTLTLAGGTGTTFKEGLAVAASPSADICYGDSTSHTIKCSYNNGSFVSVSQTIGSGTATSNGTAVAAGTSQAQPAITITGATTSDTARCALNVAPPATWQTGIVQLLPVVTSNTVTLWLSNPTAGSITPAATAFRCTVVR